MVRPTCSDQKEYIRKGAWTSEEDERLISYIKHHGEGAWKSLPRAAGLLRCGKSCRLRWINYLRPHLKRGNFTKEEDELIINLQRVIGNKWSFIAAHLPGRTDNEIKNHWNTHIKRRLLDRGKHLQLPITENNINSTIPSHQQPQIYPTFDVTKSDTDAPESDFSSSSSNNTVLFSTDQETNPEISLELSISLPQSHDAMKINDKFKLEKKWELQYPQLFRRSTSSTRSLSLSKESVCLCYNLRGYQNGYGTSSCTKCASMMTTNVDAANKFYRPLSLYGN